MATVVERKRRDWGTPIYLDLAREGEGADPVNLTGATIELQAESITNAQIVRAMAVENAVEDANNPARVSYTPQQGEFDELGDWNVEVEVTYAAGAGEETFPTGRREFIIRVLPDIA